MSEESNVQFNAAEIELTPELVAKSWETLADLNDALTLPGYFQAVVLGNPRFGNSVKELTDEILKLIVDNVSFDINERPSDSFLDTISDKAQNLNEIYLAAMIEKLSEGAHAMQMIDPKILFSEAEVELGEEEAKKVGISASQLEGVKKMVDELKDGNKGVMMIKPHELIKGIMSLGPQIAGHVEFARVQGQVVSQLPKIPEELFDKIPPSAHMIATVFGATSIVLTARARSTRMVSSMIKGAMEAVIAAKRALAMSTIAEWSQGPEAIYETIMKMAALEVEENVKRVDESKSPSNVIADLDIMKAADKAKKTSTVFSGNGTKN